MQIQQAKIKKNECNCCRTNAGIYYPEDFVHMGKVIPITTAFLTHLLLTRMFTIDVFTDERVTPAEQTFYLRAKHVDEDTLNPDIMGGICVNWDYHSGCTLKIGMYPIQCRLMIEDIKNQPQKSELIDNWKPFQNFLKLALVNYNRFFESMSEFYKFDKETGRCINIYENLYEKTTVINQLMDKELYRP